MAIITIKTYHADGMKTLVNRLILNSACQTYIIVSMF